MRGRRRLIPPRHSFFIAGEGQSERPFVSFLQHLCGEAGLHVHLDIRPQDGGGSVAVIEQAGRWLKRNRSGREYQARLVLLDRDRIEAEPQEGIQAQAAAARYKLTIVFQTPNLEGLLVRLHEGNERRKIVANEAMSELRKVWPAYQKKSLTAERLRQRFTLEDVQRAAAHDQHLRKLLEVIGLWS